MIRICDGDAVAAYDVGNTDFRRNAILSGSSCLAGLAPDALRAFRSLGAHGSAADDLNVYRGGLVFQRDLYDVVVLLQGDVDLSHQYVTSSSSLNPEGLTSVVTVPSARVT